jgi:D-aminoacyl-tRNA deacylase
MEVFMLAVVQRVSEARVTVQEKVAGSIGKGLVVLLGVEAQDTPDQAQYLATKTAGLRIFADEASRMNLSVQESLGSLLVISQFTLLGDCRKGRRPSFVRAAPPEQGKQLYDFYVNALKILGLHVETGIFGAMMNVHLINDGPVTLIIDSRRWTGERIPV